jgi:hypothetical protein
MQKCMQKNRRKLLMQHLVFKDQFMEFHEWINRIISNENPDESIIAYNFGLFESDKGYTLYLIGSAEYDAEDQDWACSNDFEPADKYLLLPPGFQNTSWENVQEKVIELLNNFMESETGLASFFARAQAITTGFDDGDLVLIK